MLKMGKALLATGLAGAILLGLQVPAHAKTAESDTRLAVANTVKLGNTFVAPKQLAASATITVTVVPGDTLSGLASRHCGNGAWTGIYNDNRSVVGGNPNLIYPGQRLVINCASGNVSTAPSTPTPATSSSGWVHPVPGLCYPWDANGFHTSARPGHQGVDLPGGRGGQAIRAVAAGTVSTAWQSGAGNYSVVSHGNGVWSVYMHQSSYAIRSGYVNAGTVIGYVGATGDASGPHLHFEIHLGSLWNGHQVDPVAFMANRGVRLGC